ncbi:MAG: bifunctional diguanylate cyclase/phosphodiesterase, partial [Janthinobacterium lividum]
MTLLRQLALVIAALFVMLFAGTIAISVTDTRAYLNAQLRTISQDTATSLGLSLSPPIAGGDHAVVESMINAVFDSGYYREVALVAVDGKTLVRRVAPVKVDGVPAWFTRMFPLETPRGEALVMAGWQQAGSVSVAANPGQAYLTLWHNSINSFWWFFAASIITSLLGMLALHFILRPLRTVEAQATAICDREYPEQARLPFTVELRSVVVAMNRMTRKIKEMFDEQTSAIERLRSDSFRDGLTGLANRRFFDMRLKQMIESDEDTLPSALIFIELKAFKSLNERLGYQAGDELLRAAAAAITEVCASSPAGETISAHFTGANFAVVLVDVTQSDAVETGQALAQALAGLFERGLVDTEEVCHIGITIQDGHSLPQLLAQADMALRAAQVKGANAVHIHEPKLDFERLAYPASQWTELLAEVIRQRRFVLHVQPVLDAGDRTTVLQFETLLRIVGNDGKLIAAGVFLPMA